METQKEYNNLINATPEWQIEENQNNSKCNSKHCEKCTDIPTKSSMLPNHYAELNKDSNFLDFLRVHKVPSIEGFIMKYILRRLSPQNLNSEKDLFKAFTCLLELFKNTENPEKMYQQAYLYFMEVFDNIKNSK